MALLFAALIATGVLLMVNQLWQPAPLLPYGMIVMTGALAFVGFLTSRYRTRLITGIASRWTTWRGTRGNLGERVLVVGAGAAGEAALWLMEMDTLRNAFSIVGFVDDAPSNLGLEIQGVPVLGGMSDIETIVKEQDIGVIAFAIRAIDSAEKARVLSICEETNLPIVMIPEILDSMHRHLPYNNSLSHDKPASLYSDLNSALDEIDTLLANESMEAARAKLTETRQRISKQVVI